MDSEKNIEAYLDGDLSDQEREEFEEQLNQDEELREKVKLQEEIRDSLKENVGIYQNLSNFSQLAQELSVSKSEKDYIEEAEQIIAEIELPEPELERKKKTANILSFGNVAIAACVVFVIGFLYFFLLDTPPEKPGEVGEEYMAMIENSFPSNSRSKSGSEIIDSLRALAFSAYEQGNKQEALNLWTQILEQNPADYKTKLFKGFILLENRNFELAKIEFNEIKKNEDEWDQAQWGLILTNLMLEDKERLKDIVCNYLSQDSYSFRKTDIIKIKDRIKISCN